jgi:hypothetical protein
VRGRVGLAGKVIEHELGYRAERARIAELTPMTHDNGMTRWLAARLDLPIGPELDMEELVLAAMIAHQPPPTERAHLLGPIDRWRLKTHRRQFGMPKGPGTTEISELARFGRPG